MPFACSLLSMYMYVSTLTAESMIINCCEEQGNTEQTVTPINHDSLDNFE